MDAMHSQPCTSSSPALLLPAPLKSRRHTCHCTGNHAHPSHLAISVLPFPGGPTSSTPLGARAPLSLKRSGARKKSTTSSSSTCGVEQGECVCVCAHVCAHTHVCVCMRVCMCTSTQVLAHLLTSTQIHLQSCSHAPAQEGSIIKQHTVFIKREGARSFYFSLAHAALIAVCVCACLHPAIVWESEGTSLSLMHFA